MKKIPTAFKRIFEGHKIVSVLPEYTNGWCKNAVENGTPTIKIDGSCCAIIDGVFYKRYDAKKGKPIPDGAIMCQNEPDAITGHLPCWIGVTEKNPADKWFIAAYNRGISDNIPIQDDTYEAIGKHFNGNPYKMVYDTIVKHGVLLIADDVNSFESAKEWIENHPEHEGIVWWYDGEPVCKLKRSDFGLKFPVKEEKKA